MRKKDKNELIARLEKLNIQTGFVKVYRLEYTSRNEVIGKKEGEDIDAGHAYIV